MTNNLISVIIPNFNRGQLIRYTIESILNQTYPHWEAIIVDDGSTDNSLNVISSYLERDKRIKLIRRERQPKGAPTCRNIGIQYAQGQYLIFLDSDDLLKEDCLYNRNYYASKKQNLDFLVFLCVIFKEDANDTNILWNIFTPEHDLERFLNLDIPWQTAAVLYKREVFDKHGLWNENLPSFQDWELAVRLLVQGIKYDKFPIPDCFWRLAQHETIGMLSYSAMHLKSHEILFDQVVSSLHKHNLMNSQIKSNVAGLYFWLAELWMKQNKLVKAVATMNKAFMNGLISFQTLLKGIMYFSILSSKRVRYRIKKLHKKLWPAHIRKKNSETFRKISTSFIRIYDQADSSG